MDTKQKRTAAPAARRPSPSGTRPTGTRQAAGTHTTAKRAPQTTRKPSAGKKVQTNVQRQPGAKRPQTTAQRSKSATRSTQRSRETKVISPDVVYLAPKPFNRKRLLLRLATVVAVVMALLMGVSLFFKVENIVVSGVNKYDEWDISEAAGITGENLLTFSRAKAAGRIQAILPYVQNVRIGIKLPNTVKIDIVEVDVTYSIKDSNDKWWLVSAEGKVVAEAQLGEEEGFTKLLGTQLENPVIGEMATALEPAPTQTDEAGNPVPPVVTGAKRLEVALDIAGYLETYGMIGQVVSIDVNNMGDIQLWYGQRYQVKLGDDMQLSYKMRCLKSVVENSNKYDSGILDISFTLDDKRVIYTPFS